ncbi:MAG: response regulator transcription factor [Bacteroidia bacterium]|nr:response regulator transcription factor [Bacteroidia bacterium]
MKLKCLIVDDEPVARKGLQEHLEAVEFLELAGACENAMKAASHLESGAIDLIFLDIHMPKLSGIDFLKTMKHAPMVIFTTAYSEYALEGYALDIIDYLMKPISFDRFLKAVVKAREFHQLRHRPDKQGNDFFFIKSDSKYEKIQYQDVQYIEAMQNYVVLHTRARKLIAYITLSGLESQLPSNQFIKPHKSFLVAIGKIQAVDRNELVLESARIPISRNLKDQVMQVIVNSNLLKR